MKNKKIFFLLFCVLIIILIALFFIVKNFNFVNSTNEDSIYNDYTPEEEISSKQMRETLVTLYFIDETNNLKNEGKLIDSLSLLENPYLTLTDLLISSPQNETLYTPFPENTKALNATLENNCVVLNFSEDILNFENDNQKYQIINTLLATLTQLNEVNSIKILVNDNLCKEFDEEYFSVH